MNGAGDLLSALRVPGRHDAGARRRASRKGRERGCSLYIAGEELVRAGIDPMGPPPEFKVWPGKRRTVLVQLYPVER